MAGVQSIERAFAVLRVLARGAAGVTEIAEQTDLPKSTVSRLLAALETEGAVEQVDAGGGYTLGSTLATLAVAGSPRASLRSTIRPFIEELSAQTGGSAGFTVLDGRHAYWVDNVDDHDELVLLADQTGQRFPLHTVPTGMALLSKMDDVAFDEFIAAPLAVDHDHALTDPVALRQRVRRVARDGAMVSMEELDPGVNAVAAAFRGPAGTWAGAIYVQGPSFRFPAEGDTDRVVRLVIDTARAVTERFSDR